MPWYVSRTIRMDDTEFVVEGEDPWNAHALDSGFLGEHARWWLRRRQDRWHREFMRSPVKILFGPAESRISRLRISEVKQPTAAEWVAARLLAAWVLWTVLRARSRGRAGPGRAGG